MYWRLCSFPQFFRVIQAGSLTLLCVCQQTEASCCRSHPGGPSYPATLTEEHLVQAAPPAPAYPWWRRRHRPQSDPCASWRSQSPEQAGREKDDTHQESEEPPFLHGHRHGDVHQHVRKWVSNWLAKKICQCLISKWINNNNSEKVILVFIQWVLFSVCLSEWCTSSNSGSKAHAQTAKGNTLECHCTVHLTTLYKAQDDNWWER